MSCYDNFLFNFLGSVFGYVVNFFYELFKNYGVAIVLFTIFTRVLMFPLTIKQQKQMIAQQRIQPKLNEIREKYANNQQLANTEMQKLYEKEGVKMSMGCGSMFAQLILFTGMYMAVRKPLTNVIRLGSEALTKLYSLFGVNPADKNSYYVEVTIFEKIRDVVERGSAALAPVTASNVVSSASDLVASASDVASVVTVADLQAALGDKADAVMAMSQRFRFLGFDLLQVASFKPFNSALILAFIVFVLQVASMYISNKINKTQSTGMQGCSPNTMAIGMGAFSFWISLTIPAAFPLYWATSSILAPVQTWITKKYFGALPMNAMAEAKRSALLCEDEKAIIEKIENRKGSKKFVPVMPEEKTDTAPKKSEPPKKKGKKK